MRHLVIGRGEVGRSVAAVFDCEAIDKDYDGGLTDFDCIHICFPYSKSFHGDVEIYRDLFDAKYIIIHSTVPIGTTNKIVGAVHSPIRGVHPHLAESIEVFVKYIGYNDEYTGDAVYDEFEEYGIEPVLIEDSNNTEAGKLLSTTYYGWNIMFEKWVYEYCEKNNLDFDTVYTHFNNTYNIGYERMDMIDVTRPVLNHNDGPIGGHCIIPNCEILRDFEPAKIITKKNDRLSGLQ